MNALQIFPNLIGVLALSGIAAKAAYDRGQTGVKPGSNRGQSPARSDPGLTLHFFTSSTRRFLARLSSVRLSATGAAWP